MEANKLKGQRSLDCHLRGRIGKSQEKSLSGLRIENMKSLLFINELFCLFAFESVKNHPIRFIEFSLGNLWGADMQKGKHYSIFVYFFSFYLRQFLPPGISSVSSDYNFTGLSEAPLTDEFWHPFCYSPSMAKPAGNR